MTTLRPIPVSNGRVLQATPVLDSYWTFAARRQDAFLRRLAGCPQPWTDDPVIPHHRFTNVYRASDRVSQYLIRNVIYEGDQTPEEVFFRTILFKLFNRIETWELLVEKWGRPIWRPAGEHFLQRYSEKLDLELEQKRSVYSAAYIMPSAPFGCVRKHQNHLHLLSQMMRVGLPAKVAAAKSLREVYELLLAQPSFGAFLAFQFAIDLNYSTICNFSEMDFVVAGPGARSGIAKCFANTDGLSPEEVITHMAKIQDDEFGRLGLDFKPLGGKRKLQLIDCQGLFCETDKYARVAHPEFEGLGGRSRIKQRFEPNPKPLPQFYPPKWGLNNAASAVQPLKPSFQPTESDRSQLDLFEERSAVT